MSLKQLREAVCAANIELHRRGIVLYTWGNVSGIDRGRGLVVIKPSGVDYADLKPEHMVVVDLDNEVVEGSLRPSSDTRTHTVLYRAFPHIGGVAHTHSRHAVAWAQARRDLACLGTTHADHCAGAIPCTAPLTATEVEGDYETNTGRSIIRRFEGLDPAALPMALVAGHGPFAWGRSPDDAVRNAVVLEEIAHMATLTTVIGGGSAPPLEDHVLSYHYKRKHGKSAWYGQESIPPAEPSHNRRLGRARRNAS